MKQICILTLQFLLFFSYKSYAQEVNCEVKQEEIKGTYTGTCLNGKANGPGKSVGIDMYEGDFKDGYPDGYGRYIWRNKNHFEGKFKKGKLDGSGEMHYITNTNQDSVVTGFWKKNKYIGLYESAYIVHTHSTKLTKVECRVTSKKGDDIYITIRQLLGSGVIIPDIVTISNISVVRGTYYTQNTSKLTNGSTTRIQDILFPFRAIFTLSNGEQTEISFFETAEYDVNIEIL